jgi:hypothetical protein
MFVRTPEIKRYIHEAATDLNLVLIKITGEIDLNNARRRILIEKRMGAAEDFSFSTTTANRTEWLSFERDNHLGADFTRHGTASADDGGKHKRFSSRK